MDDRQIGEIAMRLRGGRSLLNKLSILVMIHQAGKVRILDEELPLTANQKNAVKTKAEDVGTRITTGADNVKAILGGTADSEVLQIIQQRPSNVQAFLNAILEQGGKLGANQRTITPISQLLQRDPEEQADGSFRLPYAPEEETELATNIATLAEAVKWWVAQEVAKL